MKVHRLTDESDRFYPDFYRLYESAFPLYERRPRPQQLKALADPRFHLEAVEDEYGKFAAFNAYWDFGGYTFIEHIAVNPEARGGGIGSRILNDFFQRNPKACILEIDPPEDEISTKRLRFYVRLGFAQTPFYISPIYGTGSGDERLLILSRPEIISQSAFENFLAAYKLTV